MEQDIVKRLQRIVVGMANEEEDAVLEAIWEIERLRAENIKLKEESDGSR